MNNITKNILLCAYACEPNKGSEPGVGWDSSLHLAEQDPATNYFVITRKNNQQNIDKEYAPSNLTFIYYDLPRVFLYLKKKGNFVRVYYYLWMLGAVLKLWGKRKIFLIIHHITFVNDWLPSLFILLKNKNNFFVWGPIGSNDKIDKKFLNSFNQKTSERSKILLLTIFKKLDLFYWLCKKRSSVIIGINEKVKKKMRLSKKEENKFFNIPAIAIKNDLLKKGNIEKKRRKKFIIISVGKLIGIKNFKLSIKVFSDFLVTIPEDERGNVVYQIIGNGKQKQKLIDYSKELGIEKNVHFKGQLPQNVVMNCFQESDVFLFPTLENAGFVILEAMSHYLPIIAMDCGGPKQFVKENIKHQLVSSDIGIDEIENQLSNKIFKLYNNFELRNLIGNTNYKTVVDNFTCEHKTNSILKIYNSLTKNKS